MFVIFVKLVSDVVRRTSWPFWWSLVARGMFVEQIVVVRTWRRGNGRSRCVLTLVGPWSSVKRGGVDWVFGLVPVVEVVRVEWVCEVG